MDKPVRIAVVGAGNVGSAAAAAIVARQVGDVYLYDVVEGLAAGKAMDFNHAGPVFHTEGRVIPCDQFDRMADAAVVVVTAGAPRRAGMRRIDLLEENLAALTAIGKDVMRVCPQAVVVVITNPAEALIWLVKQQLPQLRIFGFGCSLDTLRFRYYLAKAARTSADSVTGIVIGSHDDNMIPLVRHARIDGVEAEQALSPEQTARVVADTRGAGAAIVERLKMRGSYYAAAHCAAEIVSAVVSNSGAVFPLGVVCQGEYGLRDTCLALPATVGPDGGYRIIEMDLDSEEREALDRCAVSTRQAVRDACSRVT